MVSIRRPLLRRMIGMASSVAYFAVAAWLVVIVDRSGTVVAAQGDWPAPLGIPLVADRLAVLLLATSAAALLAVLVYAVAKPRTDTEFPAFHSVYQLLAAGVALALLTGDLFTLFVAFEMMLTASYVLITYRAGGSETRSTITYVVIGLVASALLLTAIALIYAVTGTVNIADLTTKLDSVPSGLRTGLGWLLFMIFGIKAAIFPLFFWLPDSYPAAPAPVTALFAGLLTKIGVYAIVRTQTLLFPSERPVTFMLVIAGLTMVVGVLGAIAQKDMKRILSFHIVSQIGYMIMGLAFFTVSGIAATIVFIVHQIVVKAALFLVTGMVEYTEGTGAIDDISGVARRSPMIAVLFLPAALSLAGFPPFSGFIGKLALIESGFDSGRWVVVGVSLVASVLTLFSMTKIWSGVFWGRTGNAQRPAVPIGMAAGAAGLVVVSIGVALGGEALLGYAQRAAVDLLTEGAYRDVVLGRSS
ncbi:MAG: Na+/H+ antiporter subunit D [Acidimicrobiia bacterium]|nr:Na+/H+ antiporter subunit D [Acidimicrobiia bacterium]